MVETATSFKYKKEDIDEAVLATNYHNLTRPHAPTTVAVCFSVLIRPFHGFYDYKKATTRCVLARVLRYSSRLEPIILHKAPNYSIPLFSLTPLPKVFFIIPTEISYYSHSN